MIEYVEWFQSVRWQLFCTFTFAWRVSDAQAAQVFKAFVTRLEKSLRCPIAYLRGDEKRFSGCGKPAAPRHYHVLLTAAFPLDPEYIARAWMQMAGFRANGAGADVRRYDPSGNAIAYTLKFTSQPEGHWEFGNLDLVMRSPDLTKMNRRQRRRLSRHAQRVLSASSLASQKPIGGGRTTEIKNSDVSGGPSLKKVSSPRCDQVGRLMEIFQFETCHAERPLHFVKHEVVLGKTQPPNDDGDFESVRCTYGLRNKQFALEGEMATQIAPSALLREAAVSDKHLRAHWDDMKKAMGVIRKASVTFGKLCAKMQARELHKYIRKPGSRKGYISFAEYIDNVTGGEISHTTLHVSIALYKLTEGPNALTSDDVAEMPTQNAYALATKLRPTQRTPDIIEAAKKTPTREFAAKVQETLNHNLSPGEQQIVRLPFFRKLHPTVRDKLEDTIERFMQLPVVRDGDLSLTVQEKAIYAICNAAEQFASEDLDAARLTLSPETLGRPDAGDTEDYSPPGPEEIAPGLKNANYSKKERFKTGGGISDGKRCQRECDQPVSRESSFSHDGSRIRRRPYQ